MGAQVVRLIRAGLLVAAMVTVTWTTADPDLWGHVRFGRDIVEHGSLPQADPYSFASTRRWVNHEWLAEVLLFLAYDAGGPLGLIVLKSLVVAGAFGFVLLALKRAALSPVEHDLITGIALAGAISRFHAARPQIFSVLLFAALLYVLTKADSGGRRWLWFVPLLMALWANLHGGFVVGLGVLAMWIAVRSIQGGGALPRWRLAAVGTAALAATLVNPYGWTLWTFLGGTVGPSRPYISDWQPIFSMGPLLAVPFVLVAGVALTALIGTRLRIDIGYLLIVAALAVATLRVNRFDAFFTLAVMMLFVPQLEARASTRPRRTRTAVPVAPALRLAFSTAATLVVSGGTLLALSRAQCVEIRNDQAPEPEAVSFFKANALRGNVLTYFNWGEYAIWHLSPDVKVSIDGRRETVYTDEIIESHVSLYSNQPGATALADTLRADYIWLPADGAVIARLLSEGWHAIYRGETSTILARRQQVVTTPDRVSMTGPRCFPSQ